MFSYQFGYKEMKIIAVGWNYAEHNKELSYKELPKEPVIFMKPDTALLRENKSFYLPDFSEDVQYETEVVFHICKMGKNISEKFASRYYDTVGLGIDFTARDLQSHCIKNGLPWEISKGFDGSAVVGTMFPKDKFKDLNNIDFSLKLNDTIVQKGNSGNMVFGFNKLISYVSQFVTLKMGDILFTGTPSGVGPVKINDVLEGFITQEKSFKIIVK